MNVKEEELVKSIRESLLGNKNKSDDSHDKALTTLTAGTLAVSVSFISNVVHLQDACLISLLIIAWGLLTASLIINMLGHMITAEHTLKLLQDIDKRPQDREILEKRSLKYNKRIIWWNRVSVFFSLLAIILIVTFCSINIYQNAI
ncbi:hypothetical protein [Puia sp.]|jgi:hypothetical protein|uniref:hypothetical protein n=1 Tax=Puia sp. TaxID=2045100 RepID=UPI002D7EDD84|nr:hypothetical protein [Puia sp.]